MGVSSQFRYAFGVLCAVAVLAGPGAAMAQSIDAPQYDLESLDAEIGGTRQKDVCAKFSPELRELAGCDAEDDDPSLEGVEDPASLSNDAALPGPSPYDPVDPSADMVNGLSGGGGGADPFGMAIDDLTGGLVIGDMP